MIGNFNEEAQNILVKAKLEMLDLNHPYIGTEHLVLATLHTNSELSTRLKEYGLTYDKFKEQIINIIGMGSKKSEIFLYTPLLRKVIENAILDSKDNNNGEVTPYHLFSSLLEEGEGIAIRIFISMDLDVESMYEEFASKLIKKRKKKKKILAEDLGIDLTEKAKNNLLDPVIGREKEVQRVLEILCRRCKNNPLLIGLPGVGKTAIVEELSRLIANNEAGILNGKKIISIDMASLVAGTKYRGEFEDRMKKLIKEVENDNDIILFIDEIHTLVGAGGAEGAIDASNILKPALARGKIRIIGATTTAEYHKYIEKDGALERRFQKIFVEEPSISDTKNILLKLKPLYEKYHKVSMNDSIIDSIIALSEKYIYDRNRPDKELDVMDEVCSKVSLQNNTNEEASKLQKELTDIRDKKKTYILDNDIKKAYYYRQKENEVLNKLNSLELTTTNSKEVSINDIASVINNRCSIPMYEVLSDSVKSIKTIEDSLNKTIIGQDNAIKELISITKRIKLGYKDNKCYSLLFIGPTGVGKTLMAKNYAKSFLGESNFIRLDMSEYSDATSINKIIGSNPGYVGYDDKNILGLIKEKPNSILLLDEIDKAHPSVINLFYQILDEGKIKDNQGNVIRFDHITIIMTSNVGFEEIKVGFNQNKEDEVISSLKNVFPPSFINRIDNIITFNNLNKDNLIDIINNRIDYIKNKYNNITINIDNSVLEEVINKCNYHEFGARKVNKVLSNIVENKVVDAIINEKDSITITSNKVVNI